MNKNDLIHLKNNKKNKNDVDDETFLKITTKDLTRIWQKTRK